MQWRGFSFLKLHRGAHDHRGAASARFYLCFGLHRLALKSLTCRETRFVRSRLEGSVCGLASSGPVKVDGSVEDKSSSWLLNLGLLRFGARCVFGLESDALMQSVT